MARNLSHVRNAIVDPRTGIPTKAFYDVLNGLAVESDSNETILETIFQTSDFGSGSSETNNPGLGELRIEDAASRTDYDGMIQDIKDDIFALSVAVSDSNVESTLDNLSKRISSLESLIFAFISPQVEVKDDRVSELETRLWSLLATQESLASTVTDLEAKLFTQDNYS